MCMCMYVYVCACWRACACGCVRVVVYVCIPNRFKASANLSVHICLFPHRRLKWNLLPFHNSLHRIVSSFANVLLIGFASGSWLYQVPEALGAGFPFSRAAANAAAANTAAANTALRMLGILSLLL